MTAEDLVPEVTLGESLGPIQLIVTCVCGGAVAKGNLVTVTAGENKIPIVTVATATSTTFGVALKAGTTGKYIPVLRLGRVKVYAGGAVTAGAGVKSDANARAIAALAANVGITAGQAEMSAGEANDQFIIFVSPCQSGVGT